MKTILGFAQCNALINNSPSITNDIGELSQISVTSSRSIGTYSNDSQPGAVFLAFTSENDAGKPFVLTDVYKIPILQLHYWTMLRIINGQITNDKVITLQQITSEFGNSWSNLSIGNMVTDGVHWAPEWISGSIAGDQAGDNTVKIWFTDQSFQMQYPRFELIPLHCVPTADLDKLHEDFQTQKATIDAFTKGMITTALDEIIGEHPQTFIQTYSFKVYDKANTKLWQDAYWQVVGWGKNGRNDDAAYEAIKKDILENSEYDEEEWALVIPDLFNPIEYTFAPDWMSYSIPNKTVQAGVHSPVIDYETYLDLPIKVLKWYSEDHIKASLQTFPNLTRSIKLHAVAKPTNRSGQLKLLELYPDYALIPSRDVEFDSISKGTQAFIFAMQEMIIAAETMEEFSELPAGVNRVVRDGVICATKTVDGIKFLMVAKPYTESLFA
ncbi:hypothetical protein pEaSNUABM37_00149 [Erwinia phage pEa_SNUABM_37]|nr:hypothetical protein pEaSNUABM37_00149 [Erwinia phage pEa_SNUABM_37]QXO10619.1 hypothetical protein pEaSNUABM48_00149 [Erwinia phage pEa_SNUABM_48]